MTTGTFSVRLALTALLSTTSYAQIFPQISAVYDGEPIDLYVQKVSWSRRPTIIDDGSGVSLPHNTRMFLSTTATQDVDSYFTPNLLGGYVEFDTNISEKNCGCIAAIYTVLMPGRNEDGSLNSEDHHYCDANQVGGTYCPEFDIMEANTYAYHTTSHKCDAPNEFGYYANCDRAGKCVADIPTVSDFGPGSDYKINSLESFHVKIDFKKSSEGQFSGYTTTLSQGEEQLVLDKTCEDYLPYMTNDVQSGMTFALSSWSPPDPPTWLQKDRCTGSCDQDGSHSFDNFIFASGSETTPDDDEEEEEIDDC